MVGVSPLVCVAVHCSPLRTTNPLASEMEPTVEVAVAWRLLPSTRATCEVEVSPLTLSTPGTVMLPVIVDDVAVGCVVTEADSSPTPTPRVLSEATMFLVRLWFPLIDSAWIGGGTSLSGIVGGELLQPSASSDVPMAPRSMVCESDCACAFW